MNDAVIYAKYNEAGNKAIYALLSEMSNEDREKDRQSFYKSLSGLLRHIIGGTLFFLGMFKTTLAGNAEASKAIADLPPMPPEGTLDETQWKKLGTTLELVDTAYIDITKTLSDADLQQPVQIGWFGDNPDPVPLSFILSQLVVHNTHHRGQISQILDSLKIENDYSGIDITFLK